MDRRIIQAYWWLRVDKITMANKAPDNECPTRIF